MTLYIMGLVFIPMFLLLAACEGVFQIAYHFVPGFRRWFNGLCEATDNWE